ncbi:MAG: CCA tRNA nucleotidyltransferase [Pararhodobacter sp.]|nr:CCA tRNA nucleotidyltransferase [Pararhodobacter sp.]
MNAPRVSGDWLHSEDTQAVLAMLARAGFHAFCVGGCVRNALLGVPVSDVDIATDALPETVSALADLAGLRAVPTGIEHGTVTVVSGGTGYEVTTFRHDIETFGRHARVAFSIDLRADAARRDFTMNALYARADGHVIDPLGKGLADLRARRVRFVGTAENRIEEDYLRILRFFRFCAQYGDPAQGFDPQAVAACAAHAAQLENLSRERVGAEMRRLLGAPDPAPSVAAMEETGVLAHVLPGAAPDALARLVALEAAAGGAGVGAGGWIRRLAALGGEGAAERLRLSRTAAQDLQRLRAAMTGKAGPAELGYRLGAALGRDAALARAAQAGTALADGWETAIERGAAAEFPLRPVDLMPQLQGAALGAALKRAKEHWIAQDFAPGRDELVQLALSSPSTERPA